MPTSRSTGIDFIGAQALWRDPDRLEIPAQSLDEPRTQVIGRIGDFVWSAFITMRGDPFVSSPSGENAMKRKQRTSKTRALSAAELDVMHDAGTDLSAHMDLAKAVRPGRASSA